MLGAHLVAEVREVLQTCGLGLGKVGMSGGGVTRRAGDADGSGLVDEVDGAGHFGSQRDVQHGVDVVEHGHLFKIRRAHKGGVLGTALLGVDVGSFQVHAGGLGAVGGGGVFFHHGADIGQRLGAEGERGGQPRGHAFLHLAVSDGADALNRGIAGIAAARAVRVDVDETGQQHVAAGIHGGVGLCRFTGLENGDNLGIFNQNGTADKVNAGGDDMRVGDERFHGMQMKRGLPPRQLLFYRYSTRFSREKQDSRREMR